MAIAAAEYESSFPDPRRPVIDLDRIPEHVAIIMDGNGRWAQAHGVARSRGHEAGVEGVREAICGCHDLGVRYLTIYSFSTENWKRPPEEVSGLMNLFAKTLVRELRGLEDKAVRLKLIGDIAALPARTRKVFEDGIEETRCNEGMTLVFAVNYGGRQELVHACRELAGKCVAGQLDAASITERDLSMNLYTADIPDPDLLIRTSGEMRLSNFLLWQCAYSEFYVTDVLWPDFTRYDLLDAIAGFQARVRRFGGV